MAEYHRGKQMMSNLVVSNKLLTGDMFWADVLIQVFQVIKQKTIGMLRGYS
jgi:hypothetical protein